MYDGFIGEKILKLWSYEAIQPKSEFLFIKNLTPRDFSTMTASINCIWLEVGSFLTFLAQELTEKVIKMTEDQLKFSLKVT